MMHGAMPTFTGDALQRCRYLDAIAALAAGVIAEVRTRDVDEDDFLEAAHGEVWRLQQEAASEHAWIFRDPAVLLLSDRLFEALEERPDGRREWLHANLGSAVAAVARHDLMVEVVGQLGDASEEDDAEDPVEMGEMGEA